MNLEMNRNLISQDHKWMSKTYAELVSTLEEFTTTQALLGNGKRVITMTLLINQLW